MLRQASGERAVLRHWRWKMDKDGKSGESGINVKVAFAIALVLCVTTFVLIMRMEERKSRESLQRGRSQADELREEVVEAMKFVWRNYEEKAFGADGIGPISGEPKTTHGKASVLVGALDLLHMMGLKDEYERAKEAVLQKEEVKGLNGLVGAAEVTGDVNLVAKAVIAAADADPLENALAMLALSAITGDTGLKGRAMKAMGKVNGTVDVNTANRMVRVWLYTGMSTGKLGKMAKELYKKGVTELYEGVEKVEDGYELLFTRGVAGESDRVQHLACFVGGMLAIDEAHLKDGNKVAQFCYSMYESQPNGLAPEEVRVVKENDTLRLETVDGAFLLRPEVIADLFYSWRMTHEERYRVWGRKIWNAIQKNCRSTYGYATLNAASEKDDFQPVYFVTQTLRYFYLLFSDDNVIPTSQYVLTLDGHPIKIRPL